MDVSEVPTDATGLNSYMKELQKALSACRKADGKLRKLQDLRCKREAQWSQYQKELKASYLAQKRQFQKDMNSLCQDLDQAVAASRLAVANVQAFAQGQDRMEVSPEPRPHSAADSQDADDAWDMLMRQELSPSPTHAASDTVLAQALQEAHELAKATQAMQAMQLRAATPPLRRAVVTPKRGTSAGAPLSVPRRVSPAANTLPAPVQESAPADSPEMLRKFAAVVGGAGGGRLCLRPPCSLRPVPGSADAAGHRVFTCAQGCTAQVPRAQGSSQYQRDLQAATVSKAQVLHVPLSEVLQDKRDKLTAQLPVTSEHARAVTADAPPHQHAAPSSARASVLIDDDDPDQHGPSPGFGLME